MNWNTELEALLSVAYLGEIGPLARKKSALILGKIRKACFGPRFLKAFICGAKMAQFKKSEIRHCQHVMQLYGGSGAGLWMIWGGALEDLGRDSGGSITLIVESRWLNPSFKLFADFLVLYLIGSRWPNPH